MSNWNKFREDPVAALVAVAILVGFGFLLYAKNPLGLIIVGLLMLWASWRGVDEEL